MNHAEKADMLKSTIEKLYTQQGKSINYISDLLGINRPVLSKKIKSEWNLEEYSGKRPSPSTVKFLKKNKDYIISRLNNDEPVSSIAKSLDMSESRFGKICRLYDEDIRNAIDEKNNRMHDSANDRRTMFMNKSSLEYCEDEPGEVWKTILGYSDYDVSNYGRIRKISKRYNAYFLIKPQPNKNTKRLYVSLTGDNGERRTIMLHRLVAFAFCDGHSKEADTVNHIDGDILNNHADNLEWVSQSANNKHAYDELGRPVNIGHKLDYTILYKNKYEFKTVSAFARFINKSWTQANRWLEEPIKHDIKKIYNGGIPA